MIIHLPYYTEAENFKHQIKMENKNDDLDISKRIRSYLKISSISVAEVDQLAKLKVLRANQKQTRSMEHNFVPVKHKAQYPTNRIMV